MESIVKMSMNDSAGWDNRSDGGSVSNSGRGTGGTGVPYGTGREEGDPHTYGDAYAYGVPFDGSGYGVMPERETLFDGDGYSGMPEREMLFSEEETPFSEEEERRILKEKREQRRLQKRRIARREQEAFRKRKAGYRLIAAYAAATVVITYILLRLADNAGAVLTAVGGVLQTAGALLTPLFWGFILAYILSPLAASFEKRIRRARRARGGKADGAKADGDHSLAVGCTCVLVLLAAFLLLSIAVSALTRSLRIARISDLVDMAKSLAFTLGNFRQTVTDRLAEMNISSDAVSAALGEIGERVGGFMNGISTGITGAISHIGGFLTGALFSVIFAIYFLLDGKSLRRYWNRVLIAIGGKGIYREFHVLAKDADTVFSGYIRGQLIDAVVMAVMISVALSLIGMPYAAVIGILSGIGNLIPYVGPVVAYGTTVLVSLFTGDLRRLLVAIVILFVIQTVDGNIINPRLLSSSIDIHPMLVIAALLVGGAFGGIIGMLFAVPVAGFLKIQFDRIIESLLQARLPKRQERQRRRKKGRDGASRRRREKE